MKALALYHLKGGVGKTTAAVHLAHLASAAGHATLLWDLDPQGAASWVYRVRVGEETRPKRLLRDRASLWNAIRGSDYPRLDVLPADLSTTKLEQALDADDPAAPLRAALADLGSRYARIVLDCPPTLSPLTRAVFGAVDALLLPTIPTPLSLRTLASLYPRLKEARGHGLLVLPFFSLVEPRKAIHRRVRAFARAEGLGFLAAEIPTSAHLESTAALRRPLTASPHPMAAPFRDLHEEVERCLAGGAPGKLGKGRLAHLLHHLGTS